MMSARVPAGGFVLWKCDVGFSFCWIVVQDHVVDGMYHSFVVD
jgi:hypothetical protein